MTGVAQGKREGGGQGVLEQRGHLGYRCSTEEGGEDDPQQWQDGPNFLHSACECCVERDAKQCRDQHNLWSDMPSQSM